MKVVRLKKGYRITLSDTEMDILGGMESFMTAGDMDEQMSNWSPVEKAAWTRRMKDRDFFLQTDEDRR
jgi:hypothetical protein